MRTLLIVRDMWMGYTRFKEFSEGPEGILTNILSERLVRLVNSNIT
jgi:DNA-binding HxlR family transcriptional regulator